MASTKSSVRFSQDNLINFNLSIPFIYTDDICFDNSSTANSTSISSLNSCSQPNIDVLQWLGKSCNDYVKKYTVMFDSKHLSSQIISICRQYESDEKIQAALFELIGESGFDFMCDIMSKKKTLKEITPSDILNKNKNDESDELIINEKDIEKMSANQRRKYEKKMKEQQTRYLSQQEGSNDFLVYAGFDENYLDQERRLGLQGGEARQSLIDGKWREHLAPAGTTEIREQKSLPANTKRIHGPGFEEVFIPAAPRPDKPRPGELIEISKLEPWAQLAFPNMKKLNRIQSKVFEVAYNSFENMLICAPTGAGKTNIAMLSFLQLVKQHMSNNLIDKESIKAIYIAPMKALAQEVCISIYSSIIIFNLFNKYTDV